MPTEDKTPFLSPKQCFKKKIIVISLLVFLVVVVFKFLEWNLILEFGASDNQVGIQVEFPFFFFFFLEFPFLTKQNIAQRFCMKDELVSMSFCSSLFAWIKTVLYHSGHCGWIPYLWEKLLETFGLNHTYLAEFFLNHPFCCPLLEATKRQLLKAPPHCKPPPPGGGKGESNKLPGASHAVFMLDVFYSSVSRWCLYLVAWETSVSMGPKPNSFPDFHLFCFHFVLDTASPSLALHPVFH